MKRKTKKPLNKSLRVPVIAPFLLPLSLEGRGQGEGEIGGGVAISIMASK
jgi:hypothetical protein